MRTLFVVAPVVIGFLLCSCVPKSAHPLAAPETAEIDRRLVGDWYDTEDGTTFQITATDAHWMHVVVTSKPASPKDRPSMININNAPEEYDMFATNIGEHHFLNIVLAESDSGEKAKSYCFMRYTLSSGHIQLWSMSQDASFAAVRSGKLKGTVHPNKNADADVTIEDSSANLASFIKTAGVKGLFDDKASTLLPGKPPAN